MLPSLPAARIGEDSRQTMLLYLAQLSARSGGHAPASLVAYRSQPYLQAANKDVPILCDLRSMRTDANWHQGFGECFLHQSVVMVQLPPSSCHTPPLSEGCLDGFYANGIFPPKFDIIGLKHGIHCVLHRAACLSKPLRPGLAPPRRRPSPTCISP